MIQAQIRKKIILIRILDSFWKCIGNLEFFDPTIIIVLQTKKGPIQYFRKDFINVERVSFLKS
jgi:hypothetical protein